MGFLAYEMIYTLLVCIRIWHAEMGRNEMIVFVSPNRINTVAWFQKNNIPHHSMQTELILCSNAKFNHLFLSGFDIYLTGIDTVFSEQQQKSIWLILFGNHWTTINCLSERFCFLLYSS